jgi:hypothetical protein
MVARSHRPRRHLRIVHRPTGAVVAEGPIGWGITPFDSGYYVARRYLREGRFKPNFLPGVCIYKGLYVGMNYRSPAGERTWGLGWLYFLPNPLFPFIWFRLAVPRHHPELSITEFTSPA